MSQFSGIDTHTPCVLCRPIFFFVASTEEMISTAAVTTTAQATTTTKNVSGYVKMTLTGSFPYNEWSQIATVGNTNEASSSPNEMHEVKTQAVISL